MLCILPTLYTKGSKIPNNRLKKGGYSYKTSRPYPYKGDERAQAEFKKKG